MQKARMVGLLPTPDCWAERQWGSSRETGVCERGAPYRKTLGVIWGEGKDKESDMPRRDLDPLTNCSLWRRVNCGGEQILQGVEGELRHGRGMDVLSGNYLRRRRKPLLLLSFHCWPLFLFGLVYFLISHCFIIGTEYYLLSDIHC